MLFICHVWEQAEPVDAETAAQAAAVHSQVALGSVGVDAPHPSDEFFRLAIDQCFYVGGMGSLSQAEVISKEDFRYSLTKTSFMLSSPLHPGNTVVLCGPSE